jgi:CO dehydrogenase/acetyl-CoA synthase delta subunit
MMIVTGKLKAAHRDIFDNNIAVTVFLRVIDICPSQVCLLAFSFTELEIDYKDIVTCALNFTFVLVSFE